MQRIAAGEGNTLAFDAGVIQIVNDLVFHCFGKWLTGIYPPGAFVIATGAFMNTPGDKQGAASAGAVYDVDRIVLMIIHFRFSIDAMAALVRTGEVPRCYAFATLRRH